MLHVETSQYVHGSLFSGIEGFGIAAEWMGWRNAFHCEWNAFGRHINHYYWPEADSYNDITKTDFTVWRGRIDVLTGGFPCQPFSTAGKRAGTDDARYLWPEMLRAIREIRPRWVIGENVYGLVNWDGGLVFDTVCADLENEGFEVWPVVLPAAGVNAPHRRDRIWFIARNTQLHGCVTPEIGGPDSESPVTTRENPVGQSTGADSIQSTRVQRPSIKPNNGSFGEGSGQFQKGTAEIPEWNNDAEPGDTDTRSSENPNGDGRGGDQWQSKPVIREQRHIGTGDNERLPANDGETGADPNAGHTGLQGGGQYGAFDEEGQDGGEQSSGSATELYQTTDWTIWPTVSPLCSGDDGLSDLLDFAAVFEGTKTTRHRPKSAYSKWRRESIKAGGNAIVPQVAYQIFKTIELFENQPTNAGTERTTTEAA